jgi:hypothetical protein
MVGCPPLRSGPATRITPWWSSTNLVVFDKFGSLRQRGTPIMTTSDTMIGPLQEHVISVGRQAMRHVMTTRMKIAMSLEREQCLGAGHDERDPARRGYARLQTQARRHPGRNPALRWSPNRPRAPAFLSAKPGARAPFVPRGDARSRRNIGQRRVDPRGRKSVGRIRH